MSGLPSMCFTLCPLLWSGHQWCSTSLATVQLPDPYRTYQVQIQPGWDSRLMAYGWLLARWAVALTLESWCEAKSEFLAANECQWVHTKGSPWGLHILKAHCFYFPCFWDIAYWKGWCLDLCCFIWEFLSSSRLLYNAYPNVTWFNSVEPSYVTFLSCLSFLIVNSLSQHTSSHYVC